MRAGKDRVGESEGSERPALAAAPGISSAKAELHTRSTAPCRAAMDLAQPPPGSPVLPAASQSAPDAPVDRLLKRFEQSCPNPLRRFLTAHPVHFFRR